MTRQLTERLGIPVVPRDALPCHSNSTVIVFNAYGAVDNDLLASIRSFVSGAVAVAVDDGHSTSSVFYPSYPPPCLSQPNTTGYVKVRLAWLYLAPVSIFSLSPPRYLTLIDHSATSITASQCSAPCRALARDGSACRNETMNKRGLCWRHRPDKCFHTLIH